MVLEHRGQALTLAVTGRAGHYDVVLDGSRVEVRGARLEGRFLSARMDGRGWLSVTLPEEG